MSTGGAPKGNQNARKAKIWADAIRRAVARRANGDLNGGLDSLADKLVQSAASGDQWALKELGDRIDGKVPQGIIGGDPDDAPVKIEQILIRAVDAATDRPSTEGD